MIGWLLVRAGWNRQPDQAGGIDESLNALAQNSWGPIVLGLVAVGLVAYGIWELVNAKYRHIPVA
jgi:high-affinity Fe2+/Pb2+ permease